MEEIRGITFNFDGAELKPWQVAQRLYLAGPLFRDAKTLATMWAVLESESGGFLQAWHHNVERNEDGTIKRYDADGVEAMKIKSTDLGLIQRNVVHEGGKLLAMEPVIARDFSVQLFDEHPELAHGGESALIAHQLFKLRGFQPWYAYTNGSYKKSLERGILATANYLGMAMLGNTDRFARKT